MLESFSLSLTLYAALLVTAWIGRCFEGRRILG
jgi:hypothetical protein